MSEQADRIKKNAWTIVFFTWVAGGLFFGYYMWKSTPDVDPLTGKPLKTGRNNGSADPGIPFQPSQPVMPVQPTQTPPPIAIPNGRPAPSMSVGIEKRAEGVVAVVILKNNSSIAMVVPETAARDPLYKITLKFGAGNAPPNAELAAKTTSAYVEGDAQAVLFDPEHDSTVQLNPGVSHVLTIPLQPEYVLNPGSYELTVRFQPMNIVHTGSAKLPPFNVGPAIASTNFEMPMLK